MVGLTQAMCQNVQFISLGIWQIYSRRTVAIRWQMSTIQCGMKLKPAPTYMLFQCERQLDLHADPGRRAAPGTRPPGPSLQRGNGFLIEPRVE